jgi:Mechanosensitive ion channel
MTSSHLRHPWFFVIFLFCGAVLVANLVHHLVFRFTSRTDPVWGPRTQTARKHLSWPARVIFLLTCMMIALPFVPVLTDASKEQIEHWLSFALIAAIGWFIAGCVYVIETVFLQTYELKAGNVMQARRVRTQLQIFRRMAIGFVVIVTIAALLWTSNDKRIWNYGTGLLASAGVASLLLAAAAKSTASNFLAGMQIAFTGSIRIDDVVNMQGENARVEEITMSYVVLRIWDLRRLIVPLSYFIENPFFNLTRKSTDLIAPAFLYLDYTVPVDEVRAQFEVIVKDSVWWDGKMCTLHVTNLTDRVMEMRCAVSASDSSRTFELCCEVRERMVAWVKENYPAAFPTMRFSAQPQSGDSAAVIPSR